MIQRRWLSQPAQAENEQTFRKEYVINARASMCNPLEFMPRQTQPKQQWVGNLVWREAHKSIK